MNWGYRILVVYFIFISGIMFLVFSSARQNQDLVAPDYYEQELRYQEKIDETVRANQLSTEVRFEIRDRRILLFFPPEMKNNMLEAVVLLYCTADKSKDLQKKFSTTNAEIQLDIPVANKGLHELKIHWKANALTYYTVHKILIQ